MNKPRAFVRFDSRAKNWRGYRWEDESLILTANDLETLVELLYLHGFDLSGCSR